METVRHAHHLHLLQAQDAEQADHEGGGGHGHTAARGHGAESHVTRSRCCHEAVTPGYCAHCLSCCSAHTAHSAAVSCAHRGPACVSAARVSADWRVLCCEGGSSGQLRAADGRDIETVGSGCRAADSQ